MGSGGAAGGAGQGDVPLFSVRNLVKVFPNGNRGLAGVDLDLYAGECVVVAGSNGSGKTLLAEMLLGLTDPTGGEIRFQGRSLDDAGGLLRHEAGLVFQESDAQIIGETVAEDAGFGPKNLGLPQEAIRRRVQAALAAVGLEDKGDYPPRRLSGGEKRRLAVAG
ncbi:MAG: energy-coupling factor ABC transporter ATP-binding protein, partial [Spirochaetaceae bacterium]|nr:energy-coupling factor ABC transporter ATP-binding protein [Spirochaetaceae bacterium]